MPRLIIGLVGRPGSGKGTAAKYLQETYHAELFRFSSILNAVLDRIAVEKSRDNQIQLSEILRHGFGEDVLAYAIEKDALTAKSDIVVIDGIRRIDDLAALEPLPSFRLIEIATPAKLRYDRMTHRGEKAGENTMSYDEFQAQEQAPTEITIPAVAARAWKTIDNSGTAEELKAKIDAMMAELGEKPRI
jgi:dephospho-CoA kinase